jgi:4'-phosphopantetheinyl transferase
LWLVRAQVFGPVAARLAAWVLDGAETERAAALRQDRDRDTYLSGHVAMRLLLGAYLGVPPADVVLERLPCPQCGGPHGRPVVRGDPVHFSLSHSGGLCLLAFAATPVGVDVEAVPAPEVADEVGAFLHPRESAELSEVRAVDRPAAFARVWARKEAYLKGLGTGLGRAMSLDYLGARRSAPAAVRGWTVRDVAVDDGYAAAVAVRRPGAAPEGRRRR